LLVMVAMSVCVCKLELIAVCSRLCVPVLLLHVQWQLVQPCAGEVQHWQLWCGGACEWRVAGIMVHV